MISWHEDAMYEALALLKQSAGPPIRVESDPAINTEMDWEEAKPLLKRFAPKIDLVGFGLWRERYGVSKRLGRRAVGGWNQVRRRIRKDYDQIDSWGGVYGKAVRNSDNSWCCLQYIYIYTRQMGTVSLIWNTFVPVLMALWAILVLGNLQWDVTVFLSLIPVTRVPTPEEWEILITFYSFFLISVPLFLLGFGPHFADRSGGPKDGGFRLRATTMLIPFALLLILCLFFDWMLLILLCAGVIFVVIWLLEAREIIPSGHKMDYVPVFVWIQRGTDGNWSGRCATWDYAHYHARTVEYAKVQTHPKDSDKILLDMTDNWHALEMGGEVGRMSLWMSVLFVLVFNSIVFLTFFWSGTYYPSTVINLVLFVILPSLAVALCLVLVRKRFDLVKQLEYFIKDEAHLSMEKLVILWNLEEKPRLKIVNKLQNPFADFRDGICFDNFND